MGLLGGVNEDWKENSMAKKLEQEVSALGRAAAILKRMEEKKGVDYGKIHIMDGSTIERVPVVSTGILSLDLACGGGYPQGRIVEISGSEGSSKTTTTLHAIAAAQAAGGTCAFVDSEYSLDLSYAQKLGVQVQDLLLSQPDNGEQAFDVALGFAEQMTWGDIIVIDSVAAMRPKELLAGTMDEMSSAPGIHARMMAKGVPKLNEVAAKNGVLVYCTNQTRSLIGVSYGPTTDTTGGKTLKFYASQRFELKRGSQVKAGDEVVGSEIEITVTKNKVAPPFRKAKTVNIFGEGMAPHVDVLNLGIVHGVVKKSGSWISYNDTQLGQGFIKAAEFLKSEHEVLNIIREHVLSIRGMK